MRLTLLCWLLLSPWLTPPLYAYTGPLLANPGEIIEKNHLNSEPYFFYFINENQDNHRSFQTLSRFNDILQWEVTLGLTEHLAFYMLPTFSHNVNQGYHYTNIGDTTLTTAFQILRQKNRIYIPSFNVSIEETIPTGKFNFLSPDAHGTDAIGLGSYQTNFGLNVQYKTVHFKHEAVLTVNLNYLFASSVALNGLNTYGGAVDTSGKINPGHLISFDAAIEYTLTKHWILVFETFLSHRQATRFWGTMTRSTSTNISIGNGRIDQYTLAPAIEYNFNDTLGVIAGVWFSVGHNTNAFYAPAIAINYTL